MSPMMSDDGPIGSIGYRWADNLTARPGRGDPYAGMASQDAKKTNPMKASRPKNGTLAGKGRTGGKRHG
jgi:hypothetical protein